LGHRVILIPPQYVKPFIKRAKNDRNERRGLRAGDCRRLTRSSAAGAGL